MKFKEFLDRVNYLAEKFPESLEFEVITSSDSEGNSYYPVFYHASFGRFVPINRSREGDFFPLEKESEDGPHCVSSFESCNSVCVN